ncbi:30S ribosomal protein S18 [Wolbachia endosymbiont of Ctenocephalides felis wCfeJ]|uniref:30S ribosomal protein S18 n=1 Tax=Wolbachia endosymbiont of Ctenocephalides felis wCfeJ TaxID=2732594 RepID=UPI001445C2D1|nr:30S ribosomal protein S18 [Wolbachia endosymbiont of Ctenocephalides felis wCfeJ]WCR58432.1 MAG: 30S ribosomal protein S18 [Wolbachia endosymbiont of Ctenocephalides felis wCfeJ]
MTRRRSNFNDSYVSVNNRTGFRRSKACPLAASEDEDIDYKNIDLLSKFTSDYGRILPRRLTSVCARRQRKLRLAIIRARFLALVPYCTKKV